MQNPLSDSCGESKPTSSPSDITEAEWLEALNDAFTASGDDGMTTVEIAEALGKDPYSVYQRRAVQFLIRRAVNSGSVVVGHGYRNTVTGVRMRVPVYRRVR